VGRGSADKAAYHGPLRRLGCLASQGAVEPSGLKCLAAILAEELVSYEQTFGGGMTAFDLVQSRALALGKTRAEAEREGVYAALESFAAQVSRRIEELLTEAKAFPG
jgi:hypothetical protein